MNKVVQSAKYTHGRALPVGAMLYRLKSETARRGISSNLQDSTELSDVATFSPRELRRLETLLLFDRGIITAAEAQRLLNVSRSQMYKLLKGYRLNGPVAASSKRRGSASNNAFSPSVRRTVLAIIEQNYLDYGPTLTAEVLFELHGIKLSAETIRQWRIGAGIWIPDRVARRRLHQPRKRMQTFGAQLQIDGSDHDWFEARGPRCTLMVCIDDATSKLTALHFCERENREAYVRTTLHHLETFGRPIGIVTDKHASVYSSDGESKYTLALKQLNVLHTFAHSPQSKGRVERANRTLQDRLVKALRREKIDTIEAANKFAPKFIDDFNERFSQEPRCELDSHRPLEHWIDARRAFSTKTERKISRELTFSYGGNRYLIDPGAQGRVTIGKVVVIETDIDGNETFWSNGTSLSVALS